MLARVLSMVLAGSVLVACAPVYAAELGKLIVESTQAQPLKAEIEIDMAPGDPEPPIAALAPPDAYRGIGLYYNPVLRDVRFVVHRREDDRYVLRLWSAARIDNTYLEVIVWLGTPPAQVSRIYTLILEPTSVAGGVPPPPPMVSPPVAQPESRLQKVPEMPSSPPTTASAQASGPPSPAVAAPAPERTYEVKAGDTLAGIALANLPDGVTLSQMLVAIYRQNENAFLGANMNRVRQGATLTVPSAERAKAVSDEEASQVVGAQTAEYEAFRRSVAPPPAVAATAGGDQLRLAQDEQTARADDLVAYDRAIKEAKERVARLERHLSDLQQLLELKSDFLARLEAQARSAQARSAPAGKLRGTPAEVEFRKTHPCPSTSEPGEACSGYVVTHVVPLCAGGANEATNMQWLRLEEAIEQERLAQERCRRG
jgi:pilus assembly protein FimV